MIIRSRRVSSLTLRIGKARGSSPTHGRSLTMLQYTIQPLAWFVVLAVLMSFIEHQVHRRLMHRKHRLSGRLPALKKVFEHHAILHHGHYHQIFHDEPVPHGQDRHLRLSMKEGLLVID